MAGGMKAPCYKCGKMCNKRKQSNTSCDECTKKRMKYNPRPAKYLLGVPITLENRIKLSTINS